MGTTKNGIYKVDNGTDFDEIMFKTIEDMIEGAHQSLSQNGYRKLPGGLIIQWGSNGTNSVGTTVALPVAFPNQFLAVVAVPTYAAKLTGLTYSVTKKSLSQLILWTDNANYYLVDWIAIGY